jgi:hypothetical protein
MSWHPAAGQFWRMAPQIQWHGIVVAMARVIAIWIFGLLASAIIGGFAGAHFGETYDLAVYWSRCSKLSKPIPAPADGGSIIPAWRLKT